MEPPVKLHLEALHAPQRDARIIFVDDSHKCFFDGHIEFPVSVTGLWGRFFDHFDAASTIHKFFEGWATNPSSKYFARIHELRQDGVGDDEIKVRIADGWAQDALAARRVLAPGFTET